MSLRFAAALAALTALAACDGDTTLIEPAEAEPGQGEDDDGGGGDTGDGITGDRSVPPGTASPTPDDSLFRLEPAGEDAADGDGFVTGVSYDAGSDTFTVTGLPFDGE